MEFSCPSKAFKEAFSLVGRCVPAKAVRSILQSVKAVAGDGLTLVSSDGNASIRHHLPSFGVVSPGVVLFSKSLVDSILRVTDGEVLNFRLDGPKLLVSAASAKWSMGVEDPDLYPDVPEFSAASYHTLPGPDLKRLIKRTIHAVDEECFSYALGGCLVELAPTSLGFVATDGKVLARQEYPAAFAGELTEKLTRPVVPASTLNILGGILGDGPVDLGFPDTNTVQFRSGGLTVTSRLCEGRFPNWRLALPGKPIHSAKVPAGAFLRAVEQAAVFASESSRRVSFDFSADGVLRLTGAGSELGFSDVALPVEWEGDPFSADYQPGMVASAVAPLADVGDITLEFVDDKVSSVIRSGDGYFAMICPMSREMPK